LGTSSDESAHHLDVVVELGENEVSSVTIKQSILKKRDQKMFSFKFFQTILKIIKRLLHVVSRGSSKVSLFAVERESEMF
jgi:DNA-binding protein YbaB